jgi:malate synthase
MRTEIMHINRVTFSDDEGAKELFSTEFAKYLILLNDEFTPRVQELRIKRAETLREALQRGILPKIPRSKINTDDWKVAPIPDELRKPGIEISGPASVTGMLINALNPGPEGTRAEGDLDDDEDSSGYQFIDTIKAAHNRLAAVKRILTYIDPEKNKTYALEPGPLPFFMHRERGLSVDEPKVSIDGKPIPASILSTALTLFYAGKAQAKREQAIYFYLPKLESAEEARFWKEFFDFSCGYLKYLKSANLKAIILVESLPAAFQMEEMLYELGPYAAGLNAARWDFQASLLEYVMTDPNSIWPDRFGVDIKTTEFLSNIFRRLVAICYKHGAVAIGGMATALPSKEREVNKVAAEQIRADKIWEANQGFTRAWVAHIFHMKTAADPFKELASSGWKPSAEMMNPDNYPVEIKVPQGQITVEGTRRNARMLVEYLEGWLNGRGAKGIDSLAGKPGIHPALMEDLATARISVAQIAQRVRHSAKDSRTGQVHDLTLIKRLLHEEKDDILLRFKDGIDRSGTISKTYETAELNYNKSVKIALYWINRYLQLDFANLGSYTRARLDQIAAEKDAF